MSFAAKYPNVIAGPSVEPGPGYFGSNAVVQLPHA
jgi:hypothetical protein